MRLEVDTDANVLEIEEDGETTTYDLYTDEAFEELSDLWVKLGWNQKHIYTFSWFGRPVIQLPQDLVRMQEVVYEVQPDVILEIGVAHGGGLAFYASLCEAMDHGRVIGVDVEIRPHNRKALENHELFHRMTLIEGDSVSDETVQQVKSKIGPDEDALVFLDSNHSKAHVRQELEAYHDLVNPGSYIVACDGVMDLVADTPRGEPSWTEDNPSEAAKEFAAENPKFELQEPPWPFNESTLEERITHFPVGWLRRVGD